jgi:hypothetical protein
MAQPAITATRVQRAAAELESMRRSLRSWLKYRTLNDGVLAGTVATKLPTAAAKQLIAAARSTGAEQDLADKLHVLLSDLEPDAQLPNADLRSNPNAAVQLAQIAISGRAPVTAAGPSAQGAMAPWMWPAMIVGALLIAVTTAIHTAADVAKDAEEKACIRAGACTDYGFWLKAGGIVALTWFAWKELGLGEVVRGMTKKGRR